MTGGGKYIEVQGTAEGEPFSRQLLDELLELAAAGCTELTQLQQAALAGTFRRVGPSSMALRRPCSRDPGGIGEPQCQEDR